MENYSTHIISKLFSLKNLPSFSAERQVGLLLIPFLRDIFDGYEFISSEFPLKLKSNSQSKKVDFLMYSSKYRKVLLIELKTDRKMYSGNQITFYKNIKKKKWKDIFNDLKNINLNGNINTDVRVKYFNLLEILHSNKLVEIKQDITSVKKSIKDLNKSQRDKSVRSKMIKNIFNDSSPIENVSLDIKYLLPNAPVLFEDLKI